MPVCREERKEMNTMIARAQSHSGAQKQDQRVGKYLTFGLGNEEFAIQVLGVREIMGIQEITAVPQTPAYLKGVLNLRDKVVPVVDLRLKFDMPELAYTPRTCIIVAQIESQGGMLQTGMSQAGMLQTGMSQAGMSQAGMSQSSMLMIGIIVDSVTEVLTLQANDIEDTPDFGSGIETPYILGMAKIKNKVKILLDINRVFTSQEVQHLKGVTE
jgi:purine-binding chemotaxis protein CheW